MYIIVEVNVPEWKLKRYLNPILAIACTVELSDDFPQEQPLLTLQSIYHRLNGIPCHSILDNYPYSPRWNAEEQAERMR